MLCGQNAYPWDKTLKQPPTNLEVSVKDIFNLYAPESSSCLYLPNMRALNLLL
jgi:hypothetical protein